MKIYVKAEIAVRSVVGRRYFGRFSPRCSARDPIFDNTIIVRGGQAALSGALSDRSLARSLFVHLSGDSSVRPERDLDVSLEIALFRRKHRHCQQSGRILMVDQGEAALLF